MKTPRKNGNRPPAWLIAAAVALAVGPFTVIGAARAWAQATEVPEARLQHIFVDAARAYDEGRLDASVSAYEQLLKDGYVSTELLYNLGNAYFRQGSIGRAVLNYRRAWYNAPRDPDIQANMNFAMRSTGALPAVSGPLTRPLLKLSMAEWAGLVTAAYWIGAAVVCLLVFLRSARPILARAGVVLAAGLAVGLAGLGAWYGLCRTPEAVALTSGQALFAPLEGSTVHFAIPEGSIVRVQEESGDWLKIASGRQSGWVPRSTCAVVCPWQPSGGAYTMARKE